MKTTEWVCYLSLLELAEQTFPCACAGCWYEQHPAGEAFPGDRVSSTRCRSHRDSRPLEVKAPDPLLERRGA
jgi:hypothetical protein